MSANNQLSTLQKTSLFLELFSKMNKIIDEKYPKSGTQFSQFRGAIRIKMQLLELIKNRYIVDATRVEKCFKIAEKKLGLYATSADQRVLKEADEFSRRFEFARRSIILDIESFLVFSRVVLDYVPWMLQPYLKGYVTREEEKTVDFRQFCEWFQDNPDKVIDKDFRGFLLDFYSWFMDNLRNPRNDLVIHLRRSYTLDSFSSDGNIIRFKYSEGSTSKKYGLASPVVLFGEIYGFLRNLESYFLKISTV